MYTLFTAENCTQCSQVESYLTKHEVAFRKVNVDQSTECPPLQIFAFPALFADTELLGYGTDIIEYVKKKSQTI